MRRSLAAALLRSACRGSNGLGSSSIEGAVAAAAAAGSVRSISSIGNGSGGARFSSSSSSPLAAAATTTSFSSRGGAASCSQQASPAASNWKSSAPFFSCCRGIHNSSAAFDSSSSSKSPRDYYDILGVPRGAPEAEVKRAFYRLAKRHHPDANADGDQAEAARKFQEVNKAYDCLRDPQKRALYDQVGVEAFEGGVGSGGGGAGGGGGGFGGGGFGGPFGGFGGGSQQQQQQPDVDDIFAAFFGGLGGGGAPGRNPFAASASAARMRSPDIHVSVRLPFEAAARGGRRTLNLAGINGRDSRTVEIDVPPGIDSGAVLRLSGQGAPLPPNAPKGTTRGNLLVEVEVEPSPIFARRSRMGKPEDVEVSADVNFWDAALGGSVTVPTPLEGARELSLRPGTQPGDRFRMKGYGLPKLSHASRTSSAAAAPRGDQYVKVGVRVPKHLSPRAAQLLRELADEARGAGGKGSSSSSSPSSSEGKAKAA